MPPHREPDDSPDDSPDDAEKAPEATPARVLEALRLRHGASRYAAQRQLPLLKRALRAPPELRARLLGVLEAALAWDAAAARQRRGELKAGEAAAGELDERWLQALAPLIERW